MRLYQISRTKSGGIRFNLDPGSVGRHHPVVFVRSSDR